MECSTIARLIGGLALLGPAAFSNPSTAPGQVLEYTREGLLKRPEHYRDWIYLTSGFDMSYNPAVRMDQHAFDNVFVDPQAYKIFVSTGSWPDKTVLVIENRSAESKGSINRSGNYQGRVVGLEVHVKDQARFAGEWAFFDFESGAPAEIIPRSAACYSCHGAHAAVDTTFVQFYPTLLPIAQSRGTLSESYRKDNAEAERK
jgi:hypothetical protein